MAISEVRAAIATALADLGVAVHAYPPGTVSPPCIVLLPGPTYLDPGASWGSPQVGIDVRVLVSSSAGPAAMERLDDLVDGAVAALLGAGVQVTAVPGPSVDPDSAALVVDIPTTCVWKDE
jgi:hypothetical protein